MSPNITKTLTALIGKKKGGSSFQVENKLVAEGNWTMLAERKSDDDSSRIAIADFAERMAALEGNVPMALHAFPLAGSIDHFHHYMGAVIYPTMQLVALGEIEADSRVLVPDCGPMNLVFKSIADFVGCTTEYYPLEIENGLQEFSGSRPIYLRSFDGSKISDWFMHAHQADRIRCFAFELAGLKEGGSQWIRAIGACCWSIGGPPMRIIVPSDIDVSSRIVGVETSQLPGPNGVR